MTTPQTQPSPPAPLAPPADTLPAWTPAWARRLAAAARAGTSSVFVLHGNTYDLVPLADGPDAPYGTIAAFLAEQVFGRYDLVLHYDLARGLRAFAGSDARRLQEMVALADREGIAPDKIKNDPAVVLQAVDVLVRKTVMAPAGKRVRLALLIDQASFLFPAGEPGRTSFAAAGMLVTLLNWAASPHLKPLDVAFVVIDERRADLSERLTGNPHVTTIEVPLPEQGERERFVRTLVADRDVATFSDYGVADLAKLTAGLSLTSLRALLLPALRGGDRLDQSAFKALKKRLVEQQCQGLLEFVEPRWGLDSVIGFDAAKRRLREDAELLARGALETMPMGYLLCGPVGTGKSFLAYCTAKEIGIPCVVLKNFRSKYVGETEGNLERVLSVVRAMGPIMIIIDEADAALGDRDQEGDSGTGSRVFAMIATQMGDTRYRGQLIWMLLTARPDLLPIDLKRQGRAEVHIPLFYPTDEGELRQMFVALAKKIDAALDATAVPPLPTDGHLSGSDVEGMVTRAWRLSVLRGSRTITGEALAEVVSQFMPSTQSLERELQELAALVECTDRQFLPAWARQKIEDLGGRPGVQERLTAVKRLVEAG